MRRLLFVGDACVASGFARSTHHLLDAVDYRCRPVGDPWEVSVIGINHFGDPHPYPYHVYPAISGGDVGGAGRLPDLVKSLKPAVVVVQTDAWNVPFYVEAVRNVDEAVPIVGIVAIDGKNCQGAKYLNELSFTVFWTRFAEREAQQGGYVGPSAVIPLGVDLNVYKPLDKADSRSRYGEKKDQQFRKDWRECFIVGAINRNQDRKRFDLMINYFCDWVEEKQVDDAVLAIQSCPTGENHVDVEQLMEYRGFRDRLISIRPPMGQGFPEPYVNLFYNILDVALVTSQGEGFGLTVLEAMAAGKVCIVSNWAALGEWPGNGALRIKCSSTTVNRFNIYGGVMDRVFAVQALDRIYRDTPYRHWMEHQALLKSNEEQFQWSVIGAQFAQALERAVHPERIGVPRDLEGMVALDG